MEVVFDDDADHRVRAQWRALAAAGLPSQARHTGASNRPHITLALTDDITEEVRRQLAAAVAELPVPVMLGGLLLFGTRRVVLARLAVPSAELLQLQARVLSALDVAVDPHGTFGPGRWTPHVTLARRLTADQVARALEALAAPTASGGPELPGRLIRARLWDIQAKREHWLGPV